MLIISRAAGWWDYWRSVCVLGILCPFVHFSNPDKSGSGLRQGVGQDGDGWGAGLASGRLTFSPGADIWIDSLCHGSVIHSCLSFTHTHTHRRGSKQTNCATYQHLIKQFHFCHCRNQQNMLRFIFQLQFFPTGSESLSSNSKQDAVVN